MIVLLLTTRERNIQEFASDESFALPLIEENEIEIPVSPPLEGPHFTHISRSEPAEQQLTDDHVGVLPESKDTVVEPTLIMEGEEDEIILTNRPFRAALAANTIPAPVDQGIYDRIRPLQLPSTQVHMSGISLSRLADMDLQEVVEYYADENDFSLWTIANAGIKGINKVTGADIALFAARDEEGEISGFKLKSKRLNITTPLQKEE
jgi:hypothetical protein